MWQNGKYASLPSFDVELQDHYDLGSRLKKRIPGLMTKCYHNTWIRRCVVGFLIAVCYLLGVASGLLGGPSIRRLGWREHDNSLCAKPTYRREWRSLSHLEKDAYIAAARCITTQPSRLGFPHHTLADDFVYVHTHKGDETLSAASFFPWHRYFLHTYEDALRSECNYSGVMPYWDWTLDWTDFHGSPLFDSLTGFGGNGDPSAKESVGHGHCVTDGPFAGLRILYFDRDEQPHCLSRAIRTGETLEFAMSKVSPRAIEVALQREDYYNFTYWLEMDTHKMLPYVMRGEFAQTSANNDPIWYVAHVNLDRLWWEWQRMDPERRLREYGGNDFAESGHAASLDDVLDVGGLLPNMTVAGMMRTDSDFLCYRY